MRKRSLDDDRPVGRRYQPLRRFIAVLGHAPMLEREGSAASILRQLGACVRTLAIQENPARFMRDEDSPDVRPRALLVEALDRADLGSAALRDIRKEPYFDSVGTLLAITVGQMGHVPLFSGFDDLIRYPYSADELYWRIRAVESRHAESRTQTRRTWGRLTVDRAGHDVYVDGQATALTEKEFALLAYLCDCRGRVLTREHLLARIWGDRYDGGPRTVDVHVSRLRAKLGDALPLQTLRGCRGYRLQMPERAQLEDEENVLQSRRDTPGVASRSPGIPRRFALLAASMDGVVEGATDA